MPSLTDASVPALTATHIEDLQLASAKLTGAKRRALQAEMTLKYCAGRARQAERVFGWGRQSVELGLHEQRTGIECLGAQELCCGQPLWEDTHPEVAALLWTLVDSQSQQDLTFRTPLCYTRLTAAEALKPLRHRGRSARAQHDGPDPQP